MLTLKQFLKECGKPHVERRHNDTTVAVLAWGNEADRRRKELWSLQDYRVAAVCGPYVELVPIPNVRLWVWPSDAPAMITLKPGQTLKYYHFKRDSEGYSKVWVEWTYDVRSKCVFANSHFEGKDCDGVITSTQSALCDIAELQNRVPDFENPMWTNSKTKMELATWQDIKFPVWQKIEQHNRDHMAEAAGY